MAAPRMMAPRSEPEPAELAGHVLTMSIDGPKLRRRGD